MRRYTRMMTLLLMCSLVSIVGCSSKLAPRTAFSDASVSCDQKVRKDCWSVTPAYVKEHALLLDRLIRATAALKICQEK